MKEEILKKYSCAIKNNKWTVLIFIIGLGLLILPQGNETKKEHDTDEQISIVQYKTETEKSLESILSEIKGAGRVKVMVTFSDSGSTYFAVDETDISSDRNGEKSHESRTQHVLKREGSNTDEPLICSVSSPQISGVLVCAQGAADAQVKNHIISAVEALLGVKSHRVEVLERK